MKTEKAVKDFSNLLSSFVQELQTYVSTKDGQWTIKGFIDIYKKIYSISSDTKVVSKILELHLFPRILDFARKNNFEMELASHQNYYPDITFIDKQGNLFAVDLKTTYRNSDNRNQCRGFTLGSHGTYFRNRTSKKNIQYPYANYAAHFCIGIIYDRITESSNRETEIKTIDDLDKISSVIKNFLFFSAEKWRIASDKQGSSNTANIGSITCIDDLIKGNGVFSKYGENIFDDYWMNYKKLKTKTKDGKLKYISSLNEYLEYRGIPIK